MEEVKSDFSKLLEKAKEESKNSYSPYSNFPVGAACLFESGSIYLGSNIENASYCLGLCAERNALSSALCAGEKTKLIAVAVYSPRQKNCLPCGGCLQWLNEFSTMNGKYSDIKVVLEVDNGFKAYSLNELLPYGFNIN